MNTPSNAMPESYDEQRVVPASLSVDSANVLVGAT